MIGIMGTFCEPNEPAETGVVIGIDDGELSSGERYEAGCMSFGVGGTRGVEVRAFLERVADFPAAFGAGFLAADEGRSSGASGID